MTEARPTTVTEKQQFVQRLEDLAGRTPIRIIHKTPPKCPHCGDILWLESIKPHWFPYIHVDYGMKCPMCDRYYLFGLPMSRDAGLAMITWDTNPLGAMKAMDALGRRKCKWKKHGYMVPTKVFGDWFKAKDEGDQTKFQWKCPECFLVEQEWYPRSYPRGDNDPLTESEKEVLEERLRHLGYIE